MAQSAALPLDSKTSSFSWPVLVALYLVPGALTVLFFSISAPLLASAGLPPVWGLLLGALLIVVPLELGIILWYSRQQSGRVGLRPAIVYLEKLPRGRWLIGVVLGMLGAMLLPGLGVLLEPLLRSALFGWLPVWFSAGLTNIHTYPIAVQLATSVLWIVSVVLIGPIVEELYFRGFLLPRTAGGGRWAPLLNALLFAVYHFWQPYAIITITLFALPLAYLVWWRRNVTISIIAHCVVNAIAFVSLFAGIFQR